MQVLDTEFKEFILDSGLLSRKEFEVAESQAEERQLPLKKVLAMQGALSEDELRRAEAFILGLPFVDLKNERLQPEAFTLIPEPLSRLHQIVVFRTSPEAIELAMLEPESLESVSDILKSRNEKILPRLTDNASIKHALLAYQKYMQELFGDTIQKESETLKSVSAKINSETREKELRAHAEHDSLVRLSDSIVSHALLQGATDVHIEPRGGETVVRYRLGGKLHDAMMLPPHTASLLALRLKHLGNLSLGEKILPQEGGFAVESLGRSATVRLSTLPTHFGEKISLRMFQHGVSGFTLEGLGLSGRGLEIIHEALREKRGLIVVSGPKSSGKTTTLYTMLDILNTPEKNIETIESPIEYKMNGVNQAEVNEEFGFSANRGLKAIVRQDADVVMIGELAEELLPIALLASRTSLVLAGVTGSPRLYSDKARLVINQRVVKKLGTEKEKYFLNKDEVKTLGQLVSLDKMLEILKQENIIDKKAGWESVPFWKPRSRLGKRDEMIGLFDVSGAENLIEDGLMKAARGIVAIEEVVRAIIEA